MEQIRNSMDEAGAYGSMNGKRMCAMALDFEIIFGNDEQKQRARSEQAEHYANIREIEAALEEYHEWKRTRRRTFSFALALAVAPILAFLLFGCSSPSDPNPVDPIIPTDTTQAGYWRSDEIPGVITWEIRAAVVWLIPPVDSPYSLESTMIQDGDTLRIDAWHVTNPGLVYAFALAKVGQEYHGRFYSPKGIWKQRAIIFRRHG